MGKKILFLATTHSSNDPRLMYKEMELLKRKFNNLEISEITLAKAKNIKYSYIKTESFDFMGCEVKNKVIILHQNEDNYFFRFSLRWNILTKSLKAVDNFNPDIIQASDARELFLAYLLKVKTKARLIYDSHEDYVRQVLDYKGKSVKSYLKALMLFLKEFLFIRTCDHVFCTDEYLLKKYRKKLYGAKKVSLLRNFPYINNNDQKKLLSREFVQKNELRLVYIGGVNEYRGVIECANYVAKFNNEFNDKSLEFDVYSRPNKITKMLVSKGLINHISWISYPEMMKKLSYYDIGICLLLPIRKFYRNLPLKNFDYMGVGLPIITSNFGNLKKYIFLSKAGICIDPTSYEEFKKAILKMFSPETRKFYSENGIKYVGNNACFQIEGKEYINFFKKVLNNNKNNVF